MRLLRSEELPTAGAAVPIDQLERLARAWYGDRLDPDWRPRSAQESQQFLADCGLTGEFWELPS
jgi:hypothetical protein